MSIETNNTFIVSSDLKKLILSGLVGTMITRFVGNITNEFFFPVINDIFGDPKFTFNGLKIDLSQTLNSFIVIVLVYGFLKYGAYIKINGDNLDFKMDGIKVITNDLLFLIKFIVIIFIMGFILLVLKTEVFDKDNFKKR